MVNHRNISAGESRWRVQLASLRHGEMTQHLNHLGEFLNILITHINCFPKCCEVVTTLHEQFGQVEGCGLTPIS